MPKQSLGPALGLAAFLLALPVVSAGAEGADNSREAAPEKKEEKRTIADDLKALGNKIQRAMKEQGRYVGEKLGELSEEGGSWAADRALQARVKTTLIGVLGAASVARIDVDVTNGEVTLKGELASWEKVARAVQAVYQVEGVRKVVSRLRVPGSA